MTIEIAIEDVRWSDAGIESIAEVAVRAALAGAGLSAGAWEVSLLACDDARIAELNAGFRGKPSPTNVLSWPSEERGPDRPGDPPYPPDTGGDPELGDIAIAYETCLREAEASGRPFADHVRHLLVHGTLHLLGYDHETEADAARMETLEVEILATLGVPNPY